MSKHGSLLFVLATSLTISGCMLPSANPLVKNDGLSLDNLRQKASEIREARHLSPATVPALEAQPSERPSQFSLILKDIQSRQGYSILSDSASDVLSIEEAESRIKDFPDYAQNKASYDALVQWAKEHPKTIAYLRSRKIHTRFRTEAEMLKAIAKLQEELPREVSAAEQAKIDRTVAEFKQYVKNRPTRVPNGQRSIQAYYESHAGVPYVAGSSDSAIDTYANYYAINSLPSMWVPKVTQNANNECSMAAWGFVYGSWTGGNGQDYYHYVKNKYWGRAWFPDQQYSLGVTIADLTNWMREEGGFFADASRSSGNNISTLLDQIYYYNTPVVPMDNGDWVFDGAHYAVGVGYDSNNIVFSESIGTSYKTYYMPINHFAAAWEMGATRNALYAWGWMNIAWGGYHFINIGDDLHRAFVNPTNY